MTVRKIVSNSSNNKPDDFDCDTCQVRALSASYRCTMWKFSKKAGFVPQKIKRELAIRNINFTN